MYSIVNDIARYKSGKSIGRKDFGEAFNLYMINRSISMYSDINVEILNSTVNIYYKTLSAEQYYALMMMTIPKASYSKSYIKMPKKDKKTKDDEDCSAYFEESMEKINSSIEYVFGDK